MNTEDVELFDGGTSSASMPLPTDLLRRSTSNSCLMTVQPQSSPLGLNEEEPTPISVPTTLSGHLTAPSSSLPVTVPPRKPTKVDGRPNALRSFFVARLAQFGTEDMYMIGPKYIGDATVYWLRRIIWSVLVLASIALVVYQIQDRVTTYLGYPSTMLLTINYPRRMLFPQVTICNMQMSGWDKLSKKI